MTPGKLLCLPHNIATKNSKLHRSRISSTAIWIRNRETKLLKATYGSAAR